jgi:ParB-like chromosome segregation protein Spo0J
MNTFPINVIALAKIRLDGGTQPRAALDQATVDEYADAMENKAQFPAVTVFYDDTDYWLVDGFHRVAAAKKKGETRISAIIRPGSLADAQW